MIPHFAFSIIGDLNASKWDDAWYQKGINRKSTTKRDISLYSIDKKSNTDYGAILLETKTRFFVISIYTTRVRYRTVFDNTKKKLISKMVDLI